jgi:uncharacterized NAD(P)/FAD-binding protein YdhS
MARQARAATIAIIGGGFSGTLTAVHLLMRGFGAPGRLVLLNRSGGMARGLAYGTRSPHHVLNVPAGRMSAFDDDPESFMRFVGERGAPVEGGAFVSRDLYGAYLISLLTTAAARSTRVSLERVHDEVLTIEPEPDAAHALITTARGARIRADRVVLAVGNYPPQPPRLDDDAVVRFSTRFVTDPWRPGALAIVDPLRPTLLIGTGLTMVDIALELEALGKCRQVIAVSRRGLLPLPHREKHHPAPANVVSADALHSSQTVRESLRWLRDAVRRAQSAGADWRDVIAAIRPATPAWWRALPLDERRRFLRHVRPFWDVHRHRMAPELHAQFTALADAGAVAVRAGRVVSLRASVGGVVAEIRPRGGGAGETIEVGAVINCTGPAGDTRALRDPLFEHLLARGLVTPDPLGLGLELSEHNALVARDGAASATLYYVGPFARARDWEATAVPELRQHAHRLATHLIDSLG